MTFRSPCYLPAADSPQPPKRPTEERALRPTSGKSKRSELSTPEPAAEAPSRAQPRYLVTFDGLMEVPDMDDMIESLEREVEVIRSPALC